WSGRSEPKGISPFKARTRLELAPSPSTTTALPKIFFATNPSRVMSRQNARWAPIPAPGPPIASSRILMTPWKSIVAAPPGQRSPSCFIADFTIHPSALAEESNELLDFWWPHCMATVEAAELPEEHGARAGRTQPLVRTRRHKSSSALLTMKLQP